MLKQEIKEIKEDNSTDIDEQNIVEIINLKEFSKPMIDPPLLEKDDDNKKKKKLRLIDRVIFQKWHTKITLVINKEFSLTEIALIDLGANMNCIQEGLIPLKYYEKSSKRLTQANEENLIINYKIPNVHICNDGVCFETVFILIKDLSSKIILGNPFMALLSPFITTAEGIKTNVLGKNILFKFILPPISKEIYSLDNIPIIKEIDKERIYRKNRHLLSLKSEIIYERIADQLTDPILNHKIEAFRQQIETEICSNLPTAFWYRHRHIVKLPYEKDFNERQVPTKARPIQMNNELLEHCKKEIEDILNKGLIRKSKSPWNCVAFYVNKQAELELGVPRLVINYKPLNKALQWIRYPIPSKKDLFERFHEATIFSKFDMKSGFWQIQIDEKDRYKIAFTVPFGYYEWNVMPFGLKNAPSKFQNFLCKVCFQKDFFAIYVLPRSSQNLMSLSEIERL